MLESSHFISTYREACLAWPEGTPLKTRELLRKWIRKRRSRMYRLRVVVEEVKGFCDLPMVPGDSFEVDGGRLTVPPGKHVCIWALQAMMPFLMVKQRKLAEENDWVPTTSRICCPDPNGMVIYKVETVGDGGGTKEGIPPRMLVDQTACTGCRRCELACSFRHEGKYWPEVSRVKVEKDERRGLDAPAVCRQCGNAKCVEACPEDALSRDPETRAVVLSRDKCLKCYACVTACPFRAVHLDTEGFPLICDLCGGRPACVDACPTAALRFGRAGDPPARPKFAQPGKERPKRGRSLSSSNARGANGEAGGLRGRGGP